MLNNQSQDFFFLSLKWKSLICITCSVTFTILLMNKFCTSTLLKGPWASHSLPCSAGDPDLWPHGRHREEPTRRMVRGETRNLPLQESLEHHIIMITIICWVTLPVVCSDHMWWLFPLHHLCCCCRQYLLCLPPLPNHHHHHPYNPPHP